MRKIANSYFSPITFLLCVSVILSPIKIQAQQSLNSKKQLVGNDLMMNNCSDRIAALPSPTPETEKKEVVGERVKLYYFRDAAKMVTLLEAFKTQSNSEFKDLIIKNASDDEIILYGVESERRAVRRIIVTLDLPRPGINMDMWGVQISSRNPEKLAQVMIEVRGIIDQTQQDIRRTFTELQEVTRRVIKRKGNNTGKNTTINSRFKELLEDKLGYTQALDPSRPLSFADILLLMISSDNPGEALTQIADEFSGFGRQFQRWKTNSQYQSYLKKFPIESPPPFERFFRTRGLDWQNAKWVERNNEASVKALQSQIAIARFAYEYERLIHEPNKFSPYYLQQSAETVNSRMQNSLDALNADLQELFIIPTLIKIQKRVHDFKDVEYAQVGKTSIATLSGIPTEVSSSTVSTFEERPPLKLSDLLTKASDLSKQVSPFDPAGNVVGALPLSQVIGLIGAFGEEKSVWRELNSGVSLKVTPNVLRNMNSAELKLDLNTGDPGNGTQDTSVPPLARVSQHNVKTSIYVNALDFFDISSFNGESTLGGRRGFVPVVGPIWRGLFYDVPVFGKFFSWKREPQTVHHESLLLTTSFIMPTVMGVAILYPTQDTGPIGVKADTRCEVDDFAESVRTKIVELN